MEYIISVKGMESAPQGSKKHVGNGIMVETSKRLKSWRKQVEMRAKLIVDDIIMAKTGGNKGEVDCDRYNIRTS